MSLDVERSRLSRLVRVAAMGAFFCVAIASLVYAVITSPSVANDLWLFHEGATSWVEGTYRAGKGPLPLYPPFTLVLLSPLAFFEFENLKFGWLLVNLASTAAVLGLVIRLFGSDWTTEARLWLCALFLSWAPLRVTLRTGQLSLLIIALLLGALLARSKGKPFLAGAAVGVALCKVTLTWPFVAYFVWKREWRIVAVALLIPAVLTVVAAAPLEQSVLEMIREYGRLVSSAHLSQAFGWKGTTEIKLLLVSITGSEPLSGTISTVLTAVAVLFSLVAFKRRPAAEPIHLAGLSLLALWTSYHRTYDSVLCILPAAVLISFVIQGRLVRQSRFWLAGLGLLTMSIPGLLTDRLGFAEADIAGNPFGWLGLHIERLLVFGMFWWFIAVSYRSAAASGPCVRPDNTDS